jgi:O-antigen/teichoic acid export membrane protein
LFKDTFLYGGAAAFNKALSLITFPILARYFSVSEFGALDYYKHDLEIVPLNNF